MRTKPSSIYQFAHLDWSACARTRKGVIRRFGMAWRGIGWSAEDIAGEAMRTPGHHPHVPNPQEPKILLGADPRTTARRALDWMAMRPPETYQRTTKTGRTITVKRKPRRDTPVMASGVVSLPAHLEETVWPAYRSAVLEALKARYGKRLLSVVEHLDEANPHIHFFLVPLPSETFGAVHPGYSARTDARRQGLTSGKVRRAFVEAMTAWNDWLFQASGAAGFGIERLGPRRSRTLRPTALARQKEAHDGTVAEEMARSAIHLKNILESAAEAEAREKAARSELAKVQRKLREAASSPWEIVDAQIAEIQALEEQLKGLGVTPATRQSRKKD
jgi:hypothetical protein